jgi:hypothetical protein
MSDTQKLSPFYLTEFDKKFAITKDGKWAFNPEVYDVKYSLCITADWVGQQIQDQVESFIVDQKQHEVSIEHILKNIPSLIAHIRRSL